MKKNNNLHKRNCTGEVTEPAQSYKEGSTEIITNTTKGIRSKRGGSTTRTPKKLT
jgi:hypothetical protein